MSTKVLIGADVVPTKSNMDAFVTGEITDIVDKKLMQILKSVDYRIFNLEVPLTDEEKPISKCGPNLIAPIATIKGYQALSVDFLTLANNHILDQGEQGLWSTVHTLDIAGISYAGVGKTPDDAAKPYVFELGTKKIGIYCCAEHEFSIVSEKQAGANPFDPLESLDHLEQLRKRCDFVICLYHGGKEHYRYPSPNLQKICRKIADKGADLVVCQHSHCIGCEETWNGSTIVYGQGNFLFDNSDSEFWQTSVLLSVDITTGFVEYIPIRKDGNAVNLATGQDKLDIVSEMKSRSKQIQQEDFIENEYKKFAKKMIYDYLSRDSIYRRTMLFRILNKLSRNQIGKSIIERRLKRYSMLYINHYECEAHRELILKGLEMSKDD